MTSPRVTRILVAAFAVVVAALPAAAQDYPNRGITIIVPFAAGGPTDVIARLVSDPMSKTLGQQIVIENVVGAGGTTAATRAMRADPDGYTLIMGHMGTHAAAVGLYPKLAYDPRTDFEPIGVAAGTPILILAKKDFPAADLKEFLTYVKANTDKLNMAHAGVGSVSFTTCLLLNSILDVKPTAVPFNGTGPAMNALVGGQVDYMCDQIVNAVPQIKGGTIKATRSPHPSVIPHCPTCPPPGRQACPNFRFRPGTRCSPPRARPSPSSTSSMRRSARRSMIRRRAAGCWS